MRENEKEEMLKEICAIPPPLDRVSLVVCA